MGVEKDTQQAVMWYRKATELGLAEAQHGPDVAYDTSASADIRTCSKQ
jgi:TPR repeat protein